MVAVAGPFVGLFSGTSLREHRGPFVWPHGAERGGGLFESEAVRDNGGEVYRRLPIRQRVRGQVPAASTPIVYETAASDLARPTPKTGDIGEDQVGPEHPFCHVLADVLGCRKVDAAREAGKQRTAYLGPRRREVDLTGKRLVAPSFS